MHHAVNSTGNGVNITKGKIPTILLLTLFDIRDETETCTCYLTPSSDQERNNILKRDILCSKFIVAQLEMKTKRECHIVQHYCTWITWTLNLMMCGFVNVL